jgi:tRNA (mo5U34)-methyltransferase
MRLPASSPMAHFHDAEILIGQHKNLRPLLDKFPGLLQENFSNERHGDLPRWFNCLDQLPALSPSLIQLNGDAITMGRAEDCPPAITPVLRQALQGLHPWRKGPFDFFGVYIDTEWRSDWKWARVEKYMNSLEGKTVLDVGCGSGYHCWRMRGAGAATVIGIEPSPLFVVQFQAAQKYIQDPQVQVLPLRMEDLPADTQAFDNVFSMGLLYHRRSPMDHLLELRDCLKPGGQLILETLVIDGKAGEVLVPEGRYGRMGNVWFIPSCLTLASWLRKSGFMDIECVDTTPTSTDEQRSTDWMQFHSLKDFLDPADNRRTIEGHPAPIRSILTARKPA